MVNGEVLFASDANTFGEFIQELYGFTQMNYPKFYKMDGQCKLGLLAAELLSGKSAFLEAYRGEEVGVVLSNAVASEPADRQYFQSIADPADYFPSPALFVYTLPSTITGEICIRHKLKGENAFFIADQFDADLLESYIQYLLKNTHTKACIGGWVNHDETRFDAFLFTVEPVPGQYQEPLNSTLLNQLYG